MQMRSGGAPGGADRTECLPRGDYLAFLDEDATQVGIAGGQTIAVVDLHSIAVATQGTDRLYPAPGGGADRGPGGGGEIDARMEGQVTIEGIDPIAEQRAEARMLHRTP